MGDVLFAQVPEREEYAPVANRVVSPEDWQKFDAAVSQGLSIAESSRRANIDPGTGARRLKAIRKGDGGTQSAVSRDLLLPPPRATSGKGARKLPKDAAHCLDCFACFRLRYFGHVSTPWQVDAANRMVELLESPDKEHVVVNVPPGAGKSTLFTHDVIAWIIARNRSARVLIGSRTERQAKQYVGRLKTTFERTQPPTASDELKRKGLALDAVATLTGDYGRFKPTNPDVWRNEEFTVAQVNDIAGSDKERSVSAYGMDGGFLGGRYDLVIWDDLVDKRTLRTAEAREQLINMWETEAETRLEPGGLLILQGQRMRSDDLYRYALDLKAGDPEEYESDDDRPDKYHHIIYKAHFDELCKGEHGKDAPPWRPAGVVAECKRQSANLEISTEDFKVGCLLDPQRLDWRTLKTIQANRAERYLVMYQQEDTDPANALVDKIWVSGGLGDDGVEYPGCWDRDRGLAQLPKGLTGQLVSVASADPSPTRYWSIQWWVYHPDTEQRFLMDLIRQGMDAPDFLDWDHNVQAFTGIMQEWQQRSVALNLPITHWIFEANAAQRFVLQYDHAKRWQRKHAVDLIPHQTHRNKSDPEFGVQTIAPRWRHGQVRLPGKQGDPGRIAAMKLVDEVTKWPDGGTDDCVMASWFFEYQLPNIYIPDAPTPRIHPGLTGHRGLQLVPA